jgi:hypothetical protein
VYGLASCALVRSKTGDDAGTFNHCESVSLWGRNRRQLRLLFEWGVLPWKSPSSLEYKVQTDGGGLSLC